MGAARVLLVDMPFASAGHPSLGLGSLQAVLRDEGVHCDVLYANVAFARELGAAAYERIALDLPNPMLAGEWAFAAGLYDGGQQPAADYEAEVLRGRWRLADDDVDLVLEAQEKAPGFLDRCLRSVDWRSYDVVGFTSSSAQNIASLALARRVRQHSPGALLVFGGSNWDEEMGAELHRRFPFVDVAVSGEAEESLPALVRWLHHRTGADLQRIPGVVCRLAGRTVGTGPARPVADLEALPMPDYDDYFAALRVSGLTRRLRPSVHAETCRGCWWGMRHPCRFCGSPGCRRTFRQKSPAKVLAELRTLAARRGCRQLTIVDDIPSPAFFDEVLPRLAERPLPVPFFCEVRPEISREHIRLLAAAGADVQPGIESLNDNVLRAMRKGSRALEDVRLLRWCREEGMTPIWNLMCGVPGERPEDYDEMLAMVPAIRFLQPPDACGPVRLDRFSVYAADPASYGWHNVRPLQAYRYLYPFPESSLMRIAYAFEYDWVPGHDPARYSGPLQAAVAEWQRGSEQGEPRLVRTRSGAMVVDTRAEDHRERPLDDLESALMDACGAIGLRGELEERMARLFPREPGLTARIDAVLASFLEERVMVRDGDRYLSLVLGTGGAAEEA